MPIDAKDLRGFAKRVCTQEADEVTLRAAASRAYYSAYHALLPFAERLPVSDSGDVFLAHLGHRELTRRIKEWRTAAIHPKLQGMKVTSGQLVMALNTMRQMREVADYRLMSTVSFNEVNQQIERARLVHSMALQIETLVQADVAAPVGCARA